MPGLKAFLHSGLMNEHFVGFNLKEERLQLE